MERIILVNCVVLLTITLCYEAVLAVPHNYDSNALETNKRNQDEDKKYLWFGPRLGRKKRAPTDEYRNPNPDIEREREQIATLLDVIQDSPWAIVAVNEGKRHTVGFTPRLGRESGEQMISNDRWMQDPDLSGEIMSQRSPPFAPRLGRRLSPYSPRLGRETEKMA